MIQETIDIILLTCGRLDFTKRTMEGIATRIKIPFRLIVVDNASKDETPEFLKKCKEEGKIKELILLTEETKVNIATAYNMGFEYVETEYFLTMQNDIVIPDLEPCVAVQLMELMEKYPEQGGVGCRIQRIASIKWLDGDLSPARKALSAYTRIQKKSDIIKAGGFGNRNWDDMSFLLQMTKIGKKCSWANNLWCDHLGGRYENRGYDKDYKCIWSSRKFDVNHKPYPQIDPKTNIPLDNGQKIYR